MAAENTFLYFAFGSNLLRERLQMTCPSAYKVAIGRIKDYCLGFGSFSGTRNQWNGGTATILSSAGAEVWGVVWCISNNEEECLSIQEGVRKGLHSMVEVAVELDKSEPTILHCKSFKMNNFEASYPSPQYAKVLLLGAEQNALPPHYLHNLQSIKTNGSKAPVPIWDKLQLILRQSNPTTAP